MDVKRRRVPATLEHARVLAPLLSEADKLEIQHNSGREPFEALSDGLRQSVGCWSYLDNTGTPYVMQGVLPGGYIWMLCSDEIRRPRNLWFFARRAKKDLKKQFKKFGVLRNRVYAENKTHIRLIDWMGFDFGAEVNMNGNKFIEFTGVVDV